MTDSFPRKKSWPTAVIVTGVAMVLLMTLWLTSQADAGQASQTQPLRVQVTTAQKQDHYTVTREFIGQIEAARESRLGFEIGGQIATVKTDEGHTVDKGQILANLDTARLRAQLAQRKATLARVQADFDLATTTHNRIVEAIALDAVSDQSLDEASQRLAATKATVAEAEAALAAIEVDLDKAILRAPFEAFVAKRFVDEGEVIAAGTPILTLLERQLPRIRLALPPDSAADLDIGRAYEFATRATSYKARLLTLLPARQERTRGVIALFECENALGELRQGDLARLVLTREIAADGFWLPLDALTENSRGLWSCYVADPHGEGHQLTRRELALLHQTEDQAFVRGTLRNGEHVVTEGLHRLAPNLPVTLMSSQAKTHGAGGDQ